MEEKNTFTLEELSMYDGKNGNPAYVAVDGIVYDVSDVPAWAGGKHNGNMAGQDVTEVIKSKSPHGLNVLEILPVVGELVE
ncbi:cytochrome B5 [Acidaminobacter sp. JC074]|nr:cytochrome B5 [Acidaminobacter sp. JC074]